MLQSHIVLRHIVGYVRMLFSKCNLARSVKFRSSFTSLVNASILETLELRMSGRSQGQLRASLRSPNSTAFLYDGQPCMSSRVARTNSFRRFV